MIPYQNSKENILKKPLSMPEDQLLVKIYKNTKISKENSILVINKEENQPMFSLTGEAKWKKNKTPDLTKMIFTIDFMVELNNWKIC